MRAISGSGPSRAWLVELSLLAIIITMLALAFAVQSCRPKPTPAKERQELRQ